MYNVGEYAIASRHLRRIFCKAIGRFLEGAMCSFTEGNSGNSAVCHLQNLNIFTQYLLCITKPN